MRGALSRTLKSPPKRGLFSYGRHIPNLRILPKKEDFSMNSPEKRENAGTGRQPCRQASPRLSGKSPGSEPFSRPQPLRPCSRSMPCPPPRQSSTPRQAAGSGTRAYLMRLRMMRRIKPLSRLKLQKALMKARGSPWAGSGETRRNFSTRRLTVRRGRTSLPGSICSG